MGADSKIAWTDHTMNPWEGCVKVSPGCKHCYAEERDGRYHAGENWGPDSKRFLHTDSYWRQPYRWARDAAKLGRKARVFVMSLGDICEDRRDLDAHRERLWTVIRETAHALDWLLLTKRPENLRRLVPEDILRRCWVGTTAEDQQRADERIPHLLATPAAVRFVSVEPQIGPVDLTRVRNAGEVFAPFNALRRWTSGEGDNSGIDWVICGGESGPHARPYDLAWARSLRDQCRAAGVAFFEKQLGAITVDSAFVERDGTPSLIAGMRDRAGADPSEWPEDLRVREWPSSAATPR